MKYYLGNFGGLQQRHLLFIGLQIGILGSENSQEMSMPLNDVELTFDATRKKLEEVGFFEAPALHLSWQPDV